MKVKVMCRKFESREDIHYKTQIGTSCEKCNSKAFRLGIEPASSGLLAGRPLGVAFFATGPGLGLVIYIFTTFKMCSEHFHCTKLLHSAYLSQILWYKMYFFFQCSLMAIKCFICCCDQISIKYCEYISMHNKIIGM